MMTRDQVIDLLMVIRAYDNRTVDEMAIRAYEESARRASWEAVDAQEAAIEHFTNVPDKWLMPAHITDRIRANRRQPAPVAEIEAAPIPKGWGTGRPVQAAYQINGAIGIECAACKAQVGEYCTNPVTEQHSKIPCLSRLAGVATEWPRRA